MTTLKSSDKVKLIKALEIFPPQKLRLLNANAFWWKNIANTRKANGKIFTFERFASERQRHGAFFHCQDVHLSFFITKEELYAQVHKGNLKIVS